MSHASSPLVASHPGSLNDPTALALRAEIASLNALTIHELRARWRRLLRSAPPATLPRPVLMRLLAYKLQARAYGDLDPASAQYLNRIARDHARRRDGGERRHVKAVPPVPPVPRERGLKPGTLLIRDHGGTQHRVVVLPRGFSWQNATYTSLSEIARQITGTRWNGPRFFGLRDRA